MKEFFKKYLWLFEFIGVALIIGLGVVILAVHSVLMIIVGSAFIIFGLMRLIPLIRTTDDKVAAVIFGVEIFVNIVIGIVMIYLTTREDAQDMGALFGYLIGAVLYLRGLIYFFTSSVRKEETDGVNFLVHIGLFTLAVVIIARGGFEQETLAWVIFALAVISSLFIGLDGYSNYNQYRHQYRSESLTKKATKQKEEDVLPTSEEIITPNPGVTKEEPKEKEEENRIIT